MEFTFKSKFNLEDIVWFMYDNKPVQGIILQINYRRIVLIKTAYEHKNIFNKLKSLLSSKKEEIDAVNISYNIDIVRSDGTFISCARYKKESEIFQTKEELLKSL